MKPAKFPTPTWTAPFPYGYPEAVEQGGTVAAPLLAGFSVTLIGLVLTAPDSLRWPAVSLAVLMASTILLLAAVQFAFVARQYSVLPSDLESWWPDHDESPRWEQLRSEQEAHASSHLRWAAAFRTAYNLGVLLFLAGTTISLAPPEGGGSGRWIAFGIGAVGFLGELIWTLWESFKGSNAPPASAKRQGASSAVEESTSSTH
jgi:hypothetical protein